MASLQVMSLATGRECDLPVETIDCDRPLNLVTGHLLVLAEHHPDGLEGVFLHEREGSSRGERRSLGSEIDGSAGVCVRWWVGSCHDLLTLCIPGEGYFGSGPVLVPDPVRFSEGGTSSAFVTSTVESSKPTSE